MRRREFIKAIAGPAAAWPIVASGQQIPSPRRIGVLLVGLTPESKPAKSFIQGLRDAGYTIGGDVVVEWRLANGFGPQ
jgi:putative tryptophan/tyrosine transport system substrate-binding protein